MNRRRRVDHDKVRAARAEGLTYAAVGERFAISESWAHLICNPDKYERYTKRGMERNRATNLVACEGGCGGTAWRTRKTPDGRALCTTCRGRENQTRFRRDEDGTVVEVRCHNCKKWKPVAEFANNRAASEGLHAGCRTCLTEAKRSYRDRNREKERAAWRKQKAKRP